MKPQVFLLIAAVVLAGCIGQPAGTTGGGGAGLVITSFSPEATEVDGGSDVIFTAIVKNLGEFKVPSGQLKIKILGLDDWSTSTPEKPSDTEITGVDPVRGEEGGEFVADISVKAPAAKDVSVTYTPTARALYKYGQKTTIKLELVSKELSRRDPNRQSIATTITPGGPFVVSAKGKLLPVESGKSIPVTVQLELQNVGGGKAYTGSLDPASAELDHVTITPTGFRECSPTDKVRLVGGKSRIITCKFDIAVPAAGFITKTAELNLDYNYLVDTQTTITVLKKV